MRSLVLSLLISTSALAQEPVHVKTYDTTLLTWEASTDPQVNGYLILCQSVNDQGPWQVVDAVHFNAQATQTTVPLQRCTQSRFEIQEIYSDPVERFTSSPPDVVITTRTPGPWMEWCGDPDLNGNGIVDLGDMTRTQQLFGRHLVGDEWVP